MFGSFGSIGGGAVRARILTQSAALTSGLLTSIGGLGLLAPVTFAKTGGSANLALSTSTGGVSATAALAAGQTQSIAGTVTGADNVVVPFTLTLTGASQVPAAPTLNVTAGNGKNTITLTAGAANGSSITQHRLYASSAGGFTPGAPTLLATLVDGTPYEHTGLTNGSSVYYKAVSTNGIGDSAPSTERSGTPANGTALPQQSAIVARWSATSLGLADGAAVTSWPDMVSGQLATPDTTGPTFRASGANGKPYVDFDGTKRMALPLGGAFETAVKGSGYTILLVFQQVTASTYGIAYSFGTYTDQVITADGTLLGASTSFSTVLDTTGETFCFAGMVRDPLDGGNHRGIANGTLTVSSGNRAATGTTPAIGGSPSYSATNGKFRLSEMFVWNVALSAAEIIQFSKWCHEQHAQPYPWTSLGRFTVNNGDSISSNTGVSAGTGPGKSLGNRVAVIKGWKLGTYTSISQASKTIQSMTSETPTRLSGLPALVAPASARYYGFEYANHGADAVANAQQRGKEHISAVRALGFNHISWGTSTDVANGETNYGADPTRRAAYNSYDWVGQGGADAVINIHLDATVGVEGACPATPGPYSPNFSDTVHPSETGYVALAAYFAANLP